MRMVLSRPSWPACWCTSLFDGPRLCVLSDDPDSRGRMEARLQVRQKNLFTFLLAGASGLIIPAGRLMHFIGIAVVVLCLRLTVF